MAEPAPRRAGPTGRPARAAAQLERTDGSPAEGGAPASPADPPPEAPATPATTLTAIQTALPWLLQSASARIVNVGAAAAARTATAGMGSYTASKAGVHKLTESLAAELANRGATVNAVLPGIIDTPRNREDMPNADRTRWVSAEEVANVIAFLASPQAAAINGALIPVTGRG